MAWEGIVAAIITAAAGAAEAEKSRKQASESSTKMRKTLAAANAPTAPLPKPEEGMGGDLGQWLRKRRGRAGTVLTGDLVPPDVGKRTLLG